ncbi:MAG: CBS domain-containing protein [Pseudomonadota bacterium]
MLVKDAMSTGVKTCSKGDSIKEIASIMCFNEISGLPVVDENNTIIGIVSEKDVLSSMFPDMQDMLDSGGKPDFEDMENDYENILNNKVSQIMTSTVATVSPEMPVLRAASLMWLHKIRRIPVAENNQLVGILSMGDVHKQIFKETLMSDK